MASSFLYVRTTPTEKAAWVKAARRRRKNLSEWVTDTLNEQAK